MQIDTETLVEEFNKNPVAFMAAAGGLLMGLSKIIEAAGHARGSHAFAKDVNRRIRKEKRLRKHK